MPPETPYQSNLRPEDFAPRPGFKLSLVGVAVYLAGIATHFFLYGGRERVGMGGATAGMVAGGYVGIFLVATLISYLVFAISRSRLAGTLLFCLSIPALVFADMKVNTLADAKILPPPPATPAPTPTPAPVAPGNPTYSSSKREQYISQASDAFTAARRAKIQALTDAINTLHTAGMMSPKGLVSKEAIAERRKLVENARLANEDYIAFVTTQEATYRAELEKTPLVPNDVYVTVGQFLAKNSHVAETLAVRETEKELLKSTDDTLAMLDGSWGRWHLRDGKVSFEKPGDVDRYGKLLTRFNAAVAAQTAAQAKLTAAQGPDAGAAASAGGAASPTPEVSPAASVAPATSAAPAASPVP